MSSALPGSRRAAGKNSTALTDPSALAGSEINSAISTDSSDVDDMMDVGSKSGGVAKASDSGTPVGKSSSRGKWNAEEDELLREAVQKYGGRNWKRISEILVGRTDVQCLHRWQKVLRPGLIKGPWTQEEDDSVVDLVKKYGIKSWSFIARQLKGRLGKQCRERWVAATNTSPQPFCSLSNQLSELTLFPFASLENTPTGGTTT